MLIRVCDLEPDAEDVRHATEVKFGLDGVDYVIDLCATDEKRLREAVAEWADSARRTGRMPRPVRARASAVAAAVTAIVEKPPAPVTATAVDNPTSAGMSKEQRSDVRRWANENGYTVGPRGSIKQSIIDDYFRSH